MSVRRTQKEINSAEFAEWMAYEELEPFGPQREDERAGMIAATLANVNRDPEKKSDPFVPFDFFPRLEDMMDASSAVETGPSENVLKTKLLAWAASTQEAKQKPRSELRPRKGGRKGGP